MNGYIQTNILGQQRGLKFGMEACQQIMLKAAKLNIQLGSEIEIAIVPVIIYWGLYNNCLRKNTDPDFTYEQVYDWVEENVNNTEQITQIVECFYNSRLIKDAVETEEKKSLTSLQKEGGISLEVTAPEKLELQDMTT